MLSLRWALTHWPVVSLLPAAAHPRAGGSFPGRLFLHTSWSSPQAGQAASTEQNLSNRIWPLAHLLVISEERNWISEQGLCRS